MRGLIGNAVKFKNHNSEQCHINKEGKMKIKMLDRIIININKFRKI